MSALKVVRAGAGAGKTYDLCRTVAAAVNEGLDPARILGTTFTSRAAAELKGRIQEKLLGSTADLATAQQRADRLELAAIGTVHSVAHQLLSRYALELGLSPRLEVMTETAQQESLGRLLGGRDFTESERLAELADRLGVQSLDEQILALLSAKRGNLIADEDFRTQMHSSAERVCELLAADGPLEASPGASLLTLAEQALEQLTELTSDTTKVTAEAIRKLRQLPSRNTPHWGRYPEAARIKAGAKSGADDILDSLRNHAARVRLFPELHADLRQFCMLLAEQTIGVEQQYVEYKTERGLVDYTDLETLLLQLLNHSELAVRLQQDFQLVLVDEFQDTNPLQLAIFQRLRELSERNRWVGDPKQAIYGFRDTDPELVDGIWNSIPENCRCTLDANFRSQRGLVQLTGALFAPVFGDEANQQPQKPAVNRGVERWLFSSKNQPGDSLSLACGVAQLHREGIRFGDILILERTNRQLQETVAALESLGIPCLLESPGLMQTREAAMVLAGLRLVADRSDSLAAATVLHLQGDPNLATPEWITERIREVQQHQDAKAAAAEGEQPEYRMPWQGDARFVALEAVDRSLLSPTAVVRQVVEALGLPALIHSWGSVARRASGIDSLLQHAGEYEQQILSEGQAATLSGLILYLERLAEAGKDLRYPPLGHNAVTLMTYHGAKGLEWPVVILSGLNSDRDADVWKPVVSGGGTAEESPLEGRSLRSWTWPFGRTDGPFGSQRTGTGLETDALQSPEGEHQTQRQQEENLRLLYVGATRAGNKLVFAHREGKYAWLEKLETIDKLLRPDLGEGEHALPGIETTFVIRQLNPDLADAYCLPQEVTEQWIDAGRTAGRFAAGQRFHSPSDVHDVTGHADFELEELPGRCAVAEFPSEEQLSAFGDAIHSYLAAIPSLRACDERRRLQIAEGCLSAYDMTGCLSSTHLVAAGARFESWVQARFPGATWHTEMSAASPCAAGGHWNGILDLLLELPDGRVVIIDHKSAPIKPEACGKKAATFSDQLAAYREIVTANGLQVDSLWIHFPVAGVMARCPG